LAGSVLCNDLLEYYQNKQLLKTAQQRLKDLNTLNADYDALLERSKKDPNLIDRIVSVTLGTESNDPNIAYPAVRPEQLAAAKKALNQASNQPSPVLMTPSWLTRCSEPARRISLFLAGAFLVLLSFIFFSSTKQNKFPNEKPKKRNLPREAPRDT